MSQQTTKAIFDEKQFKIMLDVIHRKVFEDGMVLTKARNWNETSALLVRKIVMFGPYLSRWKFDHESNELTSHQHVDLATSPQVINVNQRGLRLVLATSSNGIE